MEGRRWFLILCVLFCLLATMLSAAVAKAAVIETSAMVAYSKAGFSDGFKSSQRRYSAGIEFKFTPVSGIQFEYTDSVSKTSYPTDIGRILPFYVTESITYKDKVFSFNWVQNLVPAKWIIQPYFKLGGGKMTRKYTRELTGYGVIDRITQNVTTGVGGVGVRLFLTRSMAVKGEFNSYVPDFRFSKWKESQLMSVGLSWVF